MRVQEDFQVDAICIFFGIASAWKSSHSRFPGPKKRPFETQKIEKEAQRTWLKIALVAS